MPHDKNGKALKAGDEVIIRAVVDSVSQGENDCNVSLQVHSPAEYQPLVSTNSKACELAADIDRELDLCSALFEAGVDNWSGYEEALKIQRDREEEASV